MTTIPIQVLIVELEDGRRGIFFGTPLLAQKDHDEGNEVENVWFSDVNQIPDSANFSQISRLAMSFFQDESSTVH